ncbi:MAG: hypothetical protein HOK20_04030 [Alphaproteobacteria bacterium]|jgi:hypothetical protein|nr:hypothetical protein [Alphaproteobacteria bacterium]MBT5540743.1 hypothetical protein [Alphaproteobacteria bacterium]
MKRVFFILCVLFFAGIFQSQETYGSELISEDVFKTALESSSMTKVVGDSIAPSIMPAANRVKFKEVIKEYFSYKDYGWKFFTGPHGPYLNKRSVMESDGTRYASAKHIKEFGIKKALKFHLQHLIDKNVEIQTEKNAFRLGVMKALKVDSVVDAIFKVVQDTLHKDPTH